MREPASIPRYAPEVHGHVIPLHYAVPPKPEIASNRHLDARREWNEFSEGRVSRVKAGSKILFVVFLGIVAGLAVVAAPVCAGPIGETWTLVNGNAAWSARYAPGSVVLPDKSIVLMGGRNSTGSFLNDVWRSTDVGATWTEINASAGWSGRSYHTGVALPNGRIVLMGGSNSLGDLLNDTWRSEDGGMTWTCVNQSSGWDPRAFHTSVALSDGSIVLMGGINSSSTLLNDTWRSEDGGATWTCVNTSAGWTPRSSHASVSLLGGGIVLSGGSDGGGRNDVWRSDDGGATWTCVNESAGWPERWSLAGVALTDGSIVIMGGMTSYGLFLHDVWRSTDGGATWTCSNASAAWRGRVNHASVALPDGSIVLMGGGDNSPSYWNDVWRTDPLVTVAAPDGGQKWRRGTVHAVKWTFTDETSPTVNITLFKGDVMKKVIRSAAPIGSGSFRWKIPARFAPGKDYRIRIETDAGFVDASDAPFRILR